MFRLIKKIFIGLLTGIVITSNREKCVLLSSQKFMNQSALSKLRSNK